MQPTMLAHSFKGCQQRPSTDLEDQEISRRSTFLMYHMVPPCIPDSLEVSFLSQKSADFKQTDPAGTFYYI